MNPDTYFFVLTHKFKGEWCRARNLSEAHDDIRKVVVAALSTGSLKRQFQGSTGLTRVIEITTKSGVFEVTVVEGYERNGRPQLAPDGRKRMAFVTELKDAAKNT